MTRKASGADAEFGDDAELEGQIFGVLGGSAESQSEAAFPAPQVVQSVEFNEAAYLLVYPDAAASIAGNEAKSAFDHYLQVGHGEDRLLAKPYITALGAGVPLNGPGSATFSVDAMFISESGVVLVVGWVDDRACPLMSITVNPGLPVGIHVRELGRSRRVDVEGVLQGRMGHAFGYWAVFRIPASGGEPIWRIRGRLADGSWGEAEAQPRIMSDIELRETILGYFASTDYYGNPDVEASSALDHGPGAEIIRLNRSISSAIISRAHVERYGPANRVFRASLVVCLFGKHEFLFLQAALFSAGRNSAEYEFVYVSNSPELMEVLHKEATIATRIYGLSITLVFLPGNAGFSAANNVAAKYAQSDRIVIINPDVFPRDQRWAEKHAVMVDALPKTQTAMFGTTLYYDDGSLMHGGMYFDIDRGMSITEAGVSRRNLVRVEHYGKGAASSSARYTQSRAVPAVTGAFISVDRAWFELLGGFTLDHLFGHYEDADLCMKALSRGRPAWLHDIRFWHMEGKGSTRRAAHEGGSRVNRWWFTRNWGGLIEAEVLGPSPRHALLRTADGLPKLGITPPPMPEPLVRPRRGRS